MRLLVIQHVPHERLGTFEPVFKAAGASLMFFNAYEPKVVWPSLMEFDAIVSMGGPQSVYQQDRYPYLARELTLLREALKAKRPILGVCLGAQLLANALGAPVTAAAQKEIGWHPIMREPGADGDPLFAPFGQTETVFQWHGDTFALPKGAVRLASSPLCEEQAFRFSHNVYGLQFHLEVTEVIVRAWLQTAVNKAELARLRGTIDPMAPPPAAGSKSPARCAEPPLAAAAGGGVAIRRQSAQHVKRLAELANHLARTFALLVRAQKDRNEPCRIIS